jgi:hypothetical protein
MQIRAVSYESQTVFRTMALSGPQRLWGRSNGAGLSRSVYKPDLKSQLHLRALTIFSEPSKRNSDHRNAVSQSSFQYMGFTIEIVGAARRVPRSLA